MPLSYDTVAGDTKSPTRLVPRAEPTAFRRLAWLDNAGTASYEQPGYEPTNWQGRMLTLISIQQ